MSRPETGAVKTLANHEPVLIAGGGIGGLATAIALARHGIGSHILERRDEFSEAGAGIQLGPNGMRVLQRLGVADMLRPLAGIPESINVFGGASGRRLACLPLGDWIADRHKAPYWVLHRRHLQYALLQVAESLPEIKITTGFSLAAVDDSAPLIGVVSTDGRGVEGRALIGADGIWSKVRETVFAAPLPKPTGAIAARAVIPRATIAPPFTGNATGIWLAETFHVVHYPVHAGRDLAIVVILSGTNGKPRRGSLASAVNAEAWDNATNADRVLRPLSAAAPELLSLLHQVPDWRHWSLYDPPELPRWTSGRVTLIGDAAHPVLPFLAQGAAMALEDADCLANTIAETRDNLPLALSAYEHARRPRTARVQAQSRRNGKIYNMPGSTAWARDLTLRITPGEKLMQSYDWLYGWGKSGTE